MVEIPKRPEPRSPYDQKNGEAATAALLTIWELHSPYCEDEECLICGVLACPLGEPMHFHHDGCPANCGR